jgi:hypothetical protein
MVMDYKDVRNKVLFAVNNRGHDSGVYLPQCFSNFPGAKIQIPRWETFRTIFNKAQSTGKFSSKTFGTFGVDKSQELVDDFNQILLHIGSMHPGRPQSVLSIVHFLSANNNSIPGDAISLYNEFRDSNHEEIPENFQQYMKPTRHADPVDGFYLQCTGSALWTFFHKDGSETTYKLLPGDGMFIPKGVEHTVETLEPRAAISIGIV